MFHEGEDTKIIGKMWKEIINMRINGRFEDLNIVDG